MDVRGFDEIARLLTSAGSRRRLLLLLAATIAGVPGSAGRGSAARAGRCRRLNKRCKRRDKCCKGAKCKRRKCRCVGDTKACAGRCIPAGGCCTDEDCRAAVECTLVECAGNLCVVSPAEAGTPCGLGRTYPCDGAGTCGNIPCVDSSTCLGEITECQGVACQDGFCRIVYASDGTPVTEQTIGDCRQVVCNGSGGTITKPDFTDVVDDGNQCTHDFCNGDNNPDHTPEPPGTECNQDGGRVCDGDGACVECVIADDCDDGQTCEAFACV